MSKSDDRVRFTDGALPALRDRIDLLEKRLKEHTEILQTLSEQTKMISKILKRLS
jgi:hypothetical protein